MDTQKRTSVTKTEISQKTIIFTILFLLFLGFLFLIRDIIFAFFVGLLIMAILDPLVTTLSKYKIPRSLSVLLTYLLVLFLLSVTIAAIIPPLAEQTGAIVSGFPAYFQNLGISVFIKDQLTQQLLSQLTNIPGNLTRLTVTFFSNVLEIVSVLVLAFYMLTERNKLDRELALFIGTDKAARITQTVDRIEKRLGGWSRAELTLMLVVGSANYIGFRIIGLPFALPLAIFAGLMEIIPYAGPVIGAVPAVLIGLSISGVSGFAAATVAFLVQQLENYVFVPKIMQHSTGVNPLITLLSLAIGFKLAGIIGVLVAIPIYLTLEVISAEYLKKEDVTKDLV